MTEVILDRHAFPYMLPIQTRWSDNDLYGHVNNVQYYSYFDTVVNHFLIHEGGLDIQRAQVIGVVNDSRCTYRSPLEYPDIIDACLRVEHLGTTSVRYGIGIFRQGENASAALGHFVHVFVDRNSMAKTPIPEPIRKALGRLVTNG